LKPHGKSKAGLLTMANYKIDSSIRFSLPIEKGINKFVDLDRCYIKSTIKTNDGNELVLYNLHLSAYSSDGSIATEQLKVLFEDMKTEYSNGKYIIAGGDFNKDLLGNSGDVFGVSGEDYSWAKPFPNEIIPDGFKLVSGYNAENPVASCRNADAPYKKGLTFEITLDGFLVSNNVTVSSYEVIDSGFKNSDHNPVKMTFLLSR
jgi:endonuclease/exonuclease/phosphatase family metal-dependent hydrolase